MYSANPLATREPIDYFGTNPSNDDYHQRCDGISRSMLEAFIDDPALFYGLYVSKEYPQSPPTPDMQFGSWVHSVVLDCVSPRDAVLGDVIEIPSYVLNGNGHRRGATWTEFAEMHPGKRLLKKEELAAEYETVDRLHAIAKSTLANKQSCALLYDNPGVNEFAMEWKDEPTGLLLKCRIDRWAEVYGSGVLIDLKTTQKCDPKSFAAACVKYGYHRQAAFYRLAAAYMGDHKLPFVFIAVRKSPPYSVACYEMDAEWIEQGEREVRKALDDIARCRDSGIWTPATADQILTLSAPRWAINNEWEI